MFIILRRADVLAGTSSSSQSSSFLLLFLLSVAGRSSYRFPAELEVSPPLAENTRKREKCYFVHLKKLRHQADSIFYITRWREIAKQIVHFDFLWSSTWLVSGLWKLKFPGCISPYSKQNGGSWAIDLLLILRTSSNLPWVFDSIAKKGDKMSVYCQCLLLRELASSFSSTV